MATSLSLTGYGPRRVLIFDGDESKYELWEVKFLGYMRIQKLIDVVVRKAGKEAAPSAEKLANAFAELVQCLDDRSLAIVIREAKDDGRKAFQVLREHYQGKGKPKPLDIMGDQASSRTNHNLCTVANRELLVLQTTVYKMLVKQKKF